MSSLPAENPWTGCGFSYQNLSPVFRTWNWKASMQEKVGPSKAPGSLLSDRPPAKRSISSGCLNKIHMYLTYKFSFENLLLKIFFF